MSRTSYGTALSLRLNSELVHTAKVVAKQTGFPLKQFLAEVIECEIATRRCREFPPEIPPDPNPNPYIPRPRGVDPNNLHGPLNNYALWLPARKNR